MAAVVLSCVVGALGATGDGFVRVIGTRFVDKYCQEYAYSGFNSWELMEAAAGIQSALPSDQSHFEGQSLVQWVFETAAENQLFVGRFFAHGHAYGGLPLQTQPGVYNEEALSALDSVIAEARNKGVKMILTLVDNWQDVDGKKTYAGWAGKKPDEFYTDPTMKLWFKNHITYMVNRVNSVSGVRYGDDDCIFAWNLINEARCDCDIHAPDESCDPQCTENIQAWFEEMSDFLKAVDPVHMVSTGQEGFYALASGRQSVNPDLYVGLPPNEYWASQSGQDFKRNHDMPGMDYATIHSWPDNWGSPTVDFQDQWVREHIVDTAALGKPLVVEEFGKAVDEDDEEMRRNVRHPFLNNMYDMFLSDMNNDSVLKGVGFWEFDANNAADPGTYGVQTTHSAWTDIILPKTQDLMNIVAALPLVENCAPGAIRAQDALVMDAPSDSYYISAGLNILDVTEGEEISSRSNVATARQCAKLCDANVACRSFAYNPTKDGGSCSLKRQVPKVDGSGGGSWNSDGWQTFRRKRGGESCSLDGCRLCTTDDMCLKCENGNLLFRSSDGTLDCKPCDTVQEALRANRGECQGPAAGKDVMVAPNATVAGTTEPTIVDAISANAG
ncbi:unnamed protein product [Ostreobium quekettii]|uniref:mannan endo-1,4-beta-mannosidase n=1 Tax=Ostreobium quekettii TaxID=121088 RepID=A0A8S1JFV4_9CHLO|nr:unnamed protein product [Ostreobium quekettii]|eukprot:evm.model.scf_102.6 EVM.evm.TU.scf_102.6   scf_102:97059-106972(-)